MGTGAWRRERDWRGRQQTQERKNAEAHEQTLKLANSERLDLPAPLASSSQGGTLWLSCPCSSPPSFLPTFRVHIATLPGSLHTGAIPVQAYALPSPIFSPPNCSFDSVYRKPKLLLQRASCSSMGRPRWEDQK